MVVSEQHLGNAGISQYFEALCHMRLAVYNIIQLLETVIPLQEDRLLQHTVCLPSAAEDSSALGANPYLSGCGLVLNVLFLASSKIEVSSAIRSSSSSSYIATSLQRLK